MGHRRPPLPRRVGRRGRGERRPRTRGGGGGHEPAGRDRRLRARHAVRERRARGLRSAPGTARARRLRPPLPGVGRVRGQRDGGEAGAGLPPGARRAGPPQGDPPLGLVPRQHALHAVALRPAQPARALRADAPGLAAGRGAVLLSLPPRSALSRVPGRLRGRPGGGDRARGCGDHRRVRGGADPGRLRRCGGAAGGLRPPDGRDVPPPRRPVHRRRGDDRLRPHRRLVRVRVERAGAGPRDLRQGNEQRLRARGRRAGAARDRGRAAGGGRLRPRLHVLASSR